MLDGSKAVLMLDSLMASVSSTNFDICYFTHNDKANL